MTNFILVAINNPRLLRCFTKKWILSKDFMVEEKVGQKLEFEIFKVFLIFGTFYTFKKFKLKNEVYTNTVL